MMLLILALGPGCASTSVTQDYPSARAAEGSLLGFYLGSRSLDEDLWAPLEDQGAFGIEYASAEPGNTGFEVGIFGAAASELGLVQGLGAVEVTALSSEVYGGVRHDFGNMNSSVRPYLGAGLSVLTAGVETLGVTVDDTSPAIYAHGGVGFHLTPGFVMGIDFRLLAGSDGDVGGVSGDADYTQFTLLIAAAL